MAEGEEAKRKGKGRWSHACGQWHTHINDDEAKQGQGEEKRARVRWDEKTTGKVTVLPTNQPSGVQQDRKGGERRGK